MGAVSGLTKRVLWVLLVAVWLLPGTVGRTPWKADEAYTFGIVQHMVETGDWVVPQLGGEPFVQKPPVLYVTAAIGGKLFGGLLGRETAFRLAVIVFQIVSLVFLGIGARELVGPGRGWFAPVLFMSCVGFMHLSHMLIPDVALVSGFAVAFAGIALSGRRPIVGGMLLGTGMGIAFLAKGLIGPGFIGLTVLLLPGCFRNWRTRSYFLSLGVAALALLPWALIWPLALYQRSPELFNQWFLDNNLGRFLGAERLGRANPLGMTNARSNFILALPGFAWPAFPFACLALWKERREAWRQPGVQLGLISMLVMLSVLSLSRNSRSFYALPILVPACLLGARGVLQVTPLWAARWRAASAVGFGLVATGMWSVWLMQFGGERSVWRARLRELGPDFQPVFQLGPFLVALAATVGWVCWMWRQPRGDNRTVPLNWCAGTSLGYLLFTTVLLPLAESDMSYRHLAPIREFTEAIRGCVMSQGLGEPQRGMFEYYGGLKTTRLEVQPEANCDWLITQTDFCTPQGRELRGPPWIPVWESLHSRKELFRLYRRAIPGAPAESSQL